MPNVPGGENTFHRLEQAGTSDPILVDGYIAAATQGNVSSVEISIDGTSWATASDSSDLATGIVRYNIHGAIWIRFTTTGIGVMSMVA